MQVGDIVNLPPDGLWYVEHITMSGAHLIGLSAFKAPITSKRLRVTKEINRHKRMRVISANANVEIVDPAALDMVAIRKRIRMARKRETEVQGTEGETQAAPAKAAADRATQSYVRTNKEAKADMRGQGKIVLDAINAAGGPVNIASLVAKIGKFEGSRQDPERVVGFYLSKFKREGYINVVDQPKNEPATV